MTDKYPLIVTALAMLGFGAFVPLAALATDDVHPSLLGALMGNAAADPQRTQIVDSAQATGNQSSSSSASASASASSSSSVTVNGDKTARCKAEATANAQANGVEDSDHDMKVVEGDGCSASAKSSATVKPQLNQQSE